MKQVRRLEVREGFASFRRLNSVTVDKCPGKLIMVILTVMIMIVFMVTMMRFSWL